MKKTLIASTIAVLLSIVSVNAGGFSWGVSVNLGCPVVYSPPVYVAPAQVVYVAPQPVVYAQPAVVYVPQPVVYTAPVVYTPHVVRYCPPPVGVTVGFGGQHHHHRGRR
jgi:hypothetical protein